MEQIADMNFMPPLPPIEIVNILNDQINYEANIVNTPADYVAINVVNFQVVLPEEPEVLPEEPEVLPEEPEVLPEEPEVLPEEPEVLPKEPEVLPEEPGEFLYVDSVSERMMLQNGWAAVEQLELWDFMKQDIENFCWSNAPEVLRIGQKMAELGYDGHSGSSFGCTLRVLQYIAQNGEAAYKILRKSE
jgi:hypothetical protein